MNIGKESYLKFKDHLILNLQLQIKKLISPFSPSFPLLPASKPTLKNKDPLAVFSFPHSL